MDEYDCCAILNDHTQDVKCLAWHPSQDVCPLVFVAHGYTGSHTGIMNYCGMNDIADQNGFAVCYPKGTTDNQWGGSNFWNVGYDFHNGINVDDARCFIDEGQKSELEMALHRVSDSKGQSKSDIKYAKKRVKKVNIFHLLTFAAFA